MCVRATFRYALSVAREKSYKLKCRRQLIAARHLLGEAQLGNALLLNRDSPR